MQCKIDHSDPLGIPEFLCRACHPELLPSAESNAAFYADLRARNAAEAAERAKAREIDNTRRKIDNMTRRGEPEADSVPAKILAGLRLKLAKLEDVL